MKFEKSKSANIKIMVCYIVIYFFREDGGNKVFRHIAAYLPQLYGVTPRNNFVLEACL
jgi:hypothetical protein